VRCYRKSSDVTFCVGQERQNPSHDPTEDEPEVPFVPDAVEEVVAAAERVFAANSRLVRLDELWDVNVYRNDDLVRMHGAHGAIFGNTSDAYGAMFGRPYDSHVVNIQVVMSGRPEFRIYGTLLHELTHAACLLISTDYLREPVHGFAWQAIMLELGLPPILLHRPPHSQYFVTDPNEYPDYAGEASHDDSRVAAMFVNRAKSRVEVGDSLWAPRPPDGTLVRGRVQRKHADYVEFRTRSRLLLGVPYDALWLGDFRL
jgi:hypothetical protein